MIRTFKSLGLLVAIILSILVSAIIIPLSLMWNFGIGVFCAFLCSIGIFALILNFISSINQQLTIKK